MLRELGFDEVRETARFAAFKGNTVEAVAEKFGVYGANVFAKRLQVYSV